MANAFDLIKVYGAGWLGEVKLAFSKNAPFLLNGVIFKRIVTPEESPVEERFGVEDLYAAYLLKTAADRFGFGRDAPEDTRRQTRFLFYVVVLELLREVHSRGELASAPRSLSTSIVKILQPDSHPAGEALLNTAIEIIDLYLTQGNENSAFQEPAYKDNFNYDLNGYLKWAWLGKGDTDSPRLRAQLAVSKK